MTATKSNGFQVVCPNCGDHFQIPQVKHNSHIAKPTLRCIECNRPILDAPLSFAGSFACEPCVAAYYRPHGAKVTAQEVRERKAEAAHRLRRLE